MEKLKCIRFDLDDPEVEYVLYQKSQERTAKTSPFSKNVNTISLYKKLKAFKSRSELDLWCALSDFEYELVDRINIEK